MSKLTTSLAVTTGVAALLLLGGRPADRTRDDLACRGSQRATRHLATHGLRGHWQESFFF
ncbi:hypothetical protein LSP04_12410 [Levilactobacillus spicheri]|uniref:Uncharacterized protein n=1 Tax=Levilactobacillus spicheri TaxID=216463 RepID=A0ABQ0WPW9_9LACO|nr:hypothetical protein LSP04_12410 [Levilactobacillus spicheri]